MRLSIFGARLEELRGTFCPNGQAAVEEGLAQMLTQVGHVGLTIDEARVQQNGVALDAGELLEARPDPGDIGLEPRLVALGCQRIHQPHRDLEPHAGQGLVIEEVEKFANLVARPVAPTHDFSDGFLDVLVVGILAAHLVGNALAELF